MNLKGISFALHENFEYIWRQSWNTYETELKICDGEGKEDTLEVQSVIYVLLFIVN